MRFRIPVTNEATGVVYDVILDADSPKTAQVLALWRMFHSFQWAFATASVAEEVE